MASTPAGKKPASPKKKSTTKPAPRKKVASASVRASSVKKPATKAPAKTKTPKPRTPKVTKPAPAPPPPAPAGFLSGRQQRFVDEYLVDLNATQAAIRAGYSPNSASEQSFDLLRKPQIAAAIAKARVAQQDRTQITADKALREAWNTVIADVRELVQVKVGCCRHCHGEGFRRQRTVTEYNHDREEFARKGGESAEFEEEGGIGFNPLRRPNPECPECSGDGQARTVVMDTRDLSEQAISIYAGAKQTKYGIEVLLNSRDAALEKLFKHLGLYEKDNGQKIDPLASLLHTIASGNNSGFKPIAQDPEHDEGGN